MLISLFGTKALINWLTTHRIGQPIRDDGPEGHHLKAGTPTMGGLAIVAARRSATSSQTSWVPSIRAPASS